MHIKQITISNFRSFKQQPEIHPFSSACNAVVGRNGSGKSNLFDAVQFVLASPRFTTLRTEERQALLHEGSGTTAVNAFVEIVFDNSDHRFSLENSDEVVLRRTVGHKKDEFFLQRKRANKNEILSLLEGAGFSKSNPYFIVQQGKVNALCTMSDAERLSLLKEVAGTTTYETKKLESLQKMQESHTKVEKIQESLQTMEDRLEELRAEKEELIEYQKLDRNRRAMEYTLYDKELRKARETLDGIEHDRASSVETLARGHEAARATHEAIRTVETSLKTHTSSLRRNRLQRQDLEQDKTQAVTTKTQLSLECKELQEQVATGEEVLKNSQMELKQLQQDIRRAQQKLDTSVGPEYESANEVLHRLQHERSEAKKKLDGLYAKQGRGRQFSSKQDRDDYLQHNVKELQGATSEKESSLQQEQESLAHLRRSAAADAASLEKQQAQVQKRVTALQSLTQKIDQQKRARVELHDVRKEQWRQSEQKKETCKEARETMHRATFDLRKVMPRATSLGLEALESIVAQEGLTHGQEYFGMLMENFELRDEKFSTAVEVAAQNSLFHVIVDTDATAALLMKRLEQDKLGRVTFLPLNRLAVEQANYPESPDVKPLLQQCLKYDRKVERAMQQVFGKKLLARTVDAASAWSSKCHMDAITLDGDLCARRGALTGGYVDHQKSRLRAYAAQVAARAALTKAEADHAQVSRKAQSTDQAVTNLMGEVSRLETKQADLNHSLTETESEIDATKSRLEGQSKQMEKIEKTTIPALEHEISSLKSEICRLQDEIGTELTETLSAEDREMLHQLKKVHTELAAEIEAQTEVVEKVSVERQKLQSLLEDNLLKRRRELMEETDAASRRRSRGGTTAQQQRREDLEQRQRELDDATRTADTIEQKLAEARKVEDELKAELIAAKGELEQLKNTDMENQRELENAQEQAERLLNKRSMCVSKRELYMRKIQELGSLPPPSALEAYTSLSISALMRELEKIAKKLKKYSHVNKKAYDQYVNFSEQRESLLKRKDELDQGAEKVKELVLNLDRQKDEAINRTFRGVSAHFKDVFKELVPNGAGELVMRTVIDEVNDTDGDDDDSEASEDQDAEKKKAFDPNNPSVSLYKGIGIKVRFSPVGENFIMSQLSGGQKALVAMALIFAIQRCDPAPFYLFDELDQALDSTYRAAVANLIQRQANSSETPTQFIVSTFRPELVAVANRCYGISHQNKVSSIHHLSKKDALHFIANLNNEDEAVGDVTSIAPSRASRLSGAASRDSRKRKSVASLEDGSEDGDEEEVDEEASAAASPMVA